MAEIVPAILTNDISDFRKKYAELFALSQHFTKLHLDFADGKFVSNTTITPHDLPFMKTSRLELVGHLMTMNPERYFWDLRKHNILTVLFHYEAVDESDIDHIIDHGHSMGLKMGLVLNPETPLHKIGKYLQNVDLVQLMGIHPGAQGRQFMSETLAKVKELRSLSKSAIISVDGGVKVGIAHKLAIAGANVIVAGSSIVLAADHKRALEDIKKDIEI